MKEESTHGNASIPASTKLSYDRTFLSYERTQMAWVRTALSLISFGFTISKFFEYLREKGGERALSPRVVGIVMIGIGLIALILGGAQHARALKSLRKKCPDLPYSIAGITGVLIAGLGILALLSSILKH